MANFNFISSFKTNIYSMTMTARSCFNLKKLSPIGGNFVAPESPVGELVFVDRKKICILPLIF